MTTPPVVSITDELIAELEAAADQVLRLELSDEPGIGDAYDAHESAANPATIKALLAHIAELKQQLAAASVDAARWRYARDLLHPLDIREFKRARDSFSTTPAEEISLKCDDAIDAARNIGSGD